MPDDTTPQIQDPLVTTVNLIGDSYTFLIIREAFFGASRFEDFASGLNISRARLTERLKHLVTLGIFEKRAYTQTSGRYKYCLSKKGLSLYQIALALHEWGNKWRPQRRQNALYHRPCRAAIAQKTVCLACNENVRYADIIWPSPTFLKASGRETINVKGWRKTGTLTHVYQRDGAAAKTFEAVGDRWSILIMYLALHGSFRFRDAKNRLGVSDNILSKRLKHLIHQQLLKQELESDKQIYVPTHAGLALLPAVLAQRMWAIEWETPTKNQWIELHHTSCGQALRTKCVCKVCEQTIYPGEVDSQGAEHLFLAD